MVLGGSLGKIREGGWGWHDRNGHERYIDRTIALAFSFAEGLGGLVHSLFVRHGVPKTGGFVTFQEPSWWGLCLNVMNYSLAHQQFGVFG